MADWKDRYDTSIDTSTICARCGAPYGEHWGMRCIEDGEDTFAASPQPPAGRQAESCDGIKCSHCDLVFSDVHEAAKHESVTLDHRVMHPAGHASPAGQQAEPTDAELDAIAATNLGDYKEGQWHRLFARAVRAFTRQPSEASGKPAAGPCGSREYCGRFPFCGCGRPDPLPERDTSKPAEQQGLFRKFDVRRTDGSDGPGGKHEGCEYFVLDVRHDVHASAALAAYAASVESTHPQLADDMRDRYDLLARHPSERPEIEQALAQLIDKIAPGLDTGDIVSDALEASRRLTRAAGSNALRSEHALSKGKCLHGTPMDENCDGCAKAERPAGRESNA